MKYLFVLFIITYYFLVFLKDYYYKFNIFKVRMGEIR